MAIARQRLTPISTQAPAVVDIPSTELSGPQWVNRFPGSRLTSDLEVPFRDYTDAFIGALRAAGASVNIGATFRPPERAYLMHWAWRIVHGSADAEAIPAMTGIDIRWDHTDSKGKFSKTLSIAAATEMVNGYNIQNLGVAPALLTRHSLRRAIDMSIKWHGTISIIDAVGIVTEIPTQPRTGMNAILIVVGESYGVIKYNRKGTDHPHWSDTGA